MDKLREMMRSNMEKPMVSVIIPTFNSEENLPKCLKSIRSQTYPFYEIIVVDNFSTDGTHEVAKRFGAKIILQKGNPALARNVGIANSNGKYVLFLDSDQFLSPSVVEDCVRISEYENVGMIRIPEVFVGKSFWDLCSASWRNSYQRVEQHIVGEEVIRGEPRFFVKKLIIQAGMLDAHLLWGENYDLYSRVRKMGIKEALCESMLSHYEPTSLKRMLVKNFRYGRSMPIFVQHTKKQVFKLIPRQSWLTFAELVKDFKTSPDIIVGCAVLLFIKAYSMVIGFLVGSSD